LSFDDEGTVARHRRFFYVEYARGSVRLRT
jgi:hypothetical protein